jgi:hypothetical protein
MRQDPLLAGIGGMLRRFKRAEAWLRKAGLPTSLAHIPVWVLCVQYCIMMRRKTARITRIAERIARWLETITEVSQHDKARLELLDMDGGMRNDIESTKRTLLLLREVCVDVGGMFHSIGFKARILESTQEKFLAVVEESCFTATTLQRAFEMHDARALALLREMEEAARPTRTGAAVDAMNDVVTDAVAGMVLAAPTHALSEPVPDRECGPMLAKPLSTAAKA